MFSILYLKKNSIKTMLSINSVFSDRKLGHEFVLSKNLIFNQKISPNTLNKKIIKLKSIILSKRKDREHLGENASHRIKFVKN
jgi:hypothetical protein